MELKEVVSKRQSIRRLKDTEISDKDIIELVEVATKAPSSMNIQNGSMSIS